MRISEGVEWALHSCLVLAGLPSGAALPSSKLAALYALPGPYLAKQMQALTRAGITESLPGPRGGYRLARPAGQISVLEVVLAVDGDEPAFRCTEIRKQGPCASAPASYVSPCGISRAMAAAEAAWRVELHRRSLADLLADATRDAPPDSLAKTAAWMEEQMR